MNPSSQSSIKLKVKESINLNSDNKKDDHFLYFFFKLYHDQLITYHKTTQQTMRYSNIAPILRF